MTNKATVKDEKLIFLKVAPKPHVMSQNKVRLTDEAAEIIERIYLETNIPLTQIASEMIKFANERVSVEMQPSVVRTVPKK